MSIRESILSADDRPLTHYQVPEWAVSFYLRPLSVEQRAKWIASYKENGPAISAVQLLVLSVHDEHKNPVFTDEDVSLLAQKSPGVVERIAKVVLDISGLQTDGSGDAALAGETGAVQ